MELSTSILNALALTKIRKIKLEWSELFEIHLILIEIEGIVSLLGFPILCVELLTPRGKNFVQSVGN